MLCPKFDQKKNRYFSLILNLLLSLFVVGAVIWWYNLLQSNRCLIYILLLDCLYKPVIIVSKLQYNNNSMFWIIKIHTWDIRSHTDLIAFYTRLHFSLIAEYTFSWLDPKIISHYQFSLYKFAVWLIQTDIQRNTFSIIFKWQFNRNKLQLTKNEILWKRFKYKKKSIWINDFIKQ